MNNTRTIVGRAGGDPEISETPTGKMLARFSVAVNGWDPDAREETTTWYKISAFEKEAQIAKDNVKKGTMVYVTGAFSVYEGTSGDQPQIKAREIGSASRFYAQEGEASEW